MIVKFRRKIRKYGGTTSFSLPIEILKAVGLKVGDEVDVYLDDSRVIVEKAK